MKQVDKVGKFTQRVVAELRQRLQQLQPKADVASQTEGETAEKDQLMQVGCKANASTAVSISITASIVLPRFH